MDKNTQDDSLARAKALLATSKQEPATVGLHMLLSLALPAEGIKRSDAYKFGVLGALQWEVHGVMVPPPYGEGTPESDAYAAGWDHGVEAVGVWG